MMASTLYELTGEYAELISALECAETEEEAAEIWCRLDMVEDDIEKKAEVYARIMRNKQSEAEAFKAEKQRLEKLQRSAERIAENLKIRLLDAMQRLNVSKIQTGIGKKGLMAKDVVEVVKGIYPKYDKVIHSKCEHGDIFGCDDCIKIDDAYDAAECFPDKSVREAD